ncbi:MAG TPA: 4Fe-4S binding protein [Cyclobacteriaceae bacterium]|nr:4Fe-4S binding protein [Cyclobacteriaceae bacterium]
MKYIQNTGLALFLLGLLLFSAIPFFGEFKLTDDDLQEVLKEEHYGKLSGELSPMLGKTYSSNIAFVKDFNRYFDGYNDKFKSNENWEEVIWDDYAFVATKAATSGWILDHNLWLFFLSVGMAALGALLYVSPAYHGEPAGVKNNGIFFSSMKSRGWLGIVTGIYLIVIYVLIYWFPEYITNWALIADPLSIFLSGNPASQWFIYGTIYTLAILVMGIRMFRKYKGNKYQTLRTASVMFFQLSFAFLLPEILVLMNMPWYDFKNIWPLDYTFFFDYRLDQMLGSGALGMFMLIWGILLIVVGVPLLTYFYGKRWYCSWVCGCGGLAETAGDPYRHLSDKRLKAWNIERYMVHAVLVIITLITLVTIVNYFSGFDLLGGGTGVLHEWYGFIIGAAFAGVVGVGFYPFMGNRVWCRFGCPLAAYLGIVQRFKSRFRITTNGGQCISCGNCSTYCEMGIDVKWYAQRGQDIIRASCVGCGVCSSVCPRGVLKLENRNETGRINENPIIIGNDSVKIQA